MVELCTAIQATIIRRQEMAERLRKSKGVIRLVALPSSRWSACSTHQNDAVTSDNRIQYSKVELKTKVEASVSECYGPC